MDRKHETQTEEYERLHYNMVIYDGPLLSKVKELFGSFYDVCLFGEKKYMRNSDFKQWIPRISNFKIRPDDVWIITYPKSGTTWTQELCWCIMNNLDFVKAKENVMMIRSPTFEWDSLLNEDFSDEMPPMADNDPCAPGVTWNLLHDTEETRIIKSHLHRFLLPKNLLESKAKIVYVCRDPRDACVSYYFYSKKIVAYTGDLEKFIQLFFAGLIHNSPYWEHVIQFWELKDKENVLFIRYEEMIEDLDSIIKRVAAFLGKELSDVDRKALSEHISFESMSNNPAANNEDIKTPVSHLGKNMKFMRKGKVGDWKNHFNESQRERFNAWIEANTRDTDFPFYKES